MYDVSYYEYLLVSFSLVLNSTSINLTIAKLFVHSNIDPSLVGYCKKQ